MKSKSDSLSVVSPESEVTLQVSDQISPSYGGCRGPYYYYLEKTIVVVFQIVVGKPLQIDVNCGSNDILKVPVYVGTTNGQSA